MKIRHFLFHAGLTAALIAVTLTGCFSPWTGGEGTLTLHLGSNSGGKAAVLPNEQNSLTYTVTLSGPGPAITETFSGGTTHTFSVQPGTWNVEVKGNKPAEGDTEIPESTLRAYGEKTVIIEAGSAQDESIEMFSATEAETYDQLAQAFADARTDGYKEYVFVTGNIAVEGSIYVSPRKNIELRAENQFTITRASAYTGSIFNVEIDGTLTLGKEGKNDKSLNIAGNFINAGVNSPLIEVGRGTLLMNDARIYGNSNTMSSSGGFGGRGGGVRVNGGTFTMNGGSIDRNTADVNGGGVSVDGELSQADGGGVNENAGIFTMTGGSIDGNTVAGYGGQVYVGMDDAFVMNAGILSGGGLSDPHASCGGGVYIEKNDESGATSGSFTKTDGTIYGSNGGNLSLNAEIGAAVYYAENGEMFLGREQTLEMADGLSTDPGGPGYENWDQDPQEEDTGNVTINQLFNEDDSLTYTVTLSDAQGMSLPSDPVELKFTELPYTFDAPPETRNVEVKGWDTNDVLRLYGESGLEINPEDESAMDIEMYPAAQVTDFDQLARAFTDAPTDGTKKYVFVTGDIAVEGIISVSSFKTIELRVENPVRIERISDYTESIFSVDEDGTLTLSKVGEPDENLTIFGGGDGFGSIGSLITVHGDLVINAARIYGNYGVLDNDDFKGGGVYVSSTGTFTMYGGIIEGNTTTYGGQVYVDSDGTFKMYDGTLSGGGLSVGDPEFIHAMIGGGVYIEAVEPSGIFEKTQGTIYGFDVTDDVKINALNGGSAVCFFDSIVGTGFYRNDTLEPTDPLTTENLDTGWDQPQ